MEAVAVTSRRPRRTLALVFGLIALMSVGALPVAAGETPVEKTELERVVDIAKAQLGAKWVFAAVGPNTFDCSGLVTYAFREAGLLDRIGGKRRTVRGFNKWFTAQGKADKIDGLPGDLIVWGRNKHIGIYLGDGMAISTLINPYGVSIHPVRGYVPIKVTKWLHVDLQRTLDEEPPPPPVE